MVTGWPLRYHRAVPLLICKRRTRPSYQRTFETQALPRSRRVVQAAHLPAKLGSRLPL